MLRFVLNHSGQRIALAEGVTVVGRGLKCDIRFNDPAVSREHLRIVVSGDRAVVVNVSASNGTLLNRQRVVRAQELHAGDQITFGYRKFVVEVADEGPSDAAGADRGNAQVPVDLEQLAEESTRPGEEPGSRRRAPSLQKLAAIERHNCPRCRAMIPFGSDSCDQCGYAWPAGHPSSVTQEIKVPETVNERRFPRVPVEVPVIYASASLTVEALVRDLSRGGMFIATDLLDAVGTACQVTVLPEGYAAMTFDGVVVHVAADPSRGRGETGLGIQFDRARTEAYDWLDDTLARHGAVES